MPRLSPPPHRHESLSNTEIVPSRCSAGQSPRSVRPPRAERRQKTEKSEAENRTTAQLRRATSAGQRASGRRRKRRPCAAREKRRDFARHAPVAGGAPGMLPWPAARLERYRGRRRAWSRSGLRWHSSGTLNRSGLRWHSSGLRAAALEQLPEPRVPSFHRDLLRRLPAPVRRVHAAGVHCEQHVHHRTRGLTLDMSRWLYI